MGLLGTKRRLNGVVREFDWREKEVLAKEDWRRKLKQCRCCKTFPNGIS